MTPTFLTHTLAHSIMNLLHIFTLLNMAFYTTARPRHQGVLIGDAERAGGKSKGSSKETSMSSKSSTSRCPQPNACTVSTWNTIQAVFSPETICEDVFKPAYNAARSCVSGPTGGGISLLSDVSNDNAEAKSCFCGSVKD